MHAKQLLPAAFVVAAVLLLPEAASAHEGQVIRFGSYLGGLSHPVLGLDHLLAMLSVGIVSVQIGGRAIWTVPATFVVVMAAGGVLGTIGFGPGISVVEVGIALSVLVLGLVIAAETSIPIALAVGAVALFASFHGYAHGAETPDIARPLVYAGGFLTGTAIIHLIGVLIGDISRRYGPGPTVLRVGGAMVSLTGGLFLLGVLG